MSYGEKIAQLRKSNGMTQEELGKVLNVTYQAVSKWERGESLPDFATMSHMAKYFQVPLDYFEDGEETAQAQPAQTNDINNIVGMCTVCGKMLKQGEEHSTSPKIICRECAERQKQEEIATAKAKEDEYNRVRAQEIYAQRGHGFDVSLIISLVLALACFITFSIMTFTADNFDDRSLYALLLFFLPLVAFGCTHGIADFINDLRDKDDDTEGYNLPISLIIGGIFAVANFVIFLVLYLNSDKNFYYLSMLIVSTVVSFTFISQFMWGTVIKAIFTGGGFTFKLPGFIFSLSPESILLMIVAKLVLGALSILIFIVTTVFLALVAVFGSVLTFIPFIIYKAVKDKKA